jgi:hypothetical protein
MGDADIFKQWLRAVLPANMSFRVSDFGQRGLKKSTDT